MPFNQPAPPLLLEAVPPRPCAACPPARGIVDVRVWLARLALSSCQAPVHDPIFTILIASRPGGQLCTIKRAKAMEICCTEVKRPRRIGLALPHDREQPKSREGGGMASLGMRCIKEIWTNYPSQ